MSDLPTRYRTHSLPGGVEIAFRRKGGDGTKPFVDVLAGDLPPLDELRSVVADLLPERPPVARFIALRAPTATARPDQHIVVGLVHALQARPPIPAPSGFTISAVPASSLTSYAEEFARFQRSGPLGREVWPASVEELERAAADGVLVGATGPDGWAGVAACLPGHVDRWSGQVVLELFVAERSRRKGLAPALQRALIDRLDPDVTLLGTIHHANTPSLATALRCGRQIVASYWWVPLQANTWLDDELSSPA